MRRLNVKLLLVLFVSALVMFVGVYVLHAMQVVKNADVTKKQALAKWKGEGGTGKGQGQSYEQARKLFDQYVRQVPDDDDGWYQRAVLAKEMMDLPSASDRDKEYAYRAIQEAAQHGAEDRFVHETLADFEMPQVRAYPMVARSVKKHLETALKSDPNNKDLIVKLARVEVVGLNELDQAATRLAALTGYDRAAKKFTRPESPAPLQAYYLLALLVGKITVPPDLPAADAIINEMIAVNPQDGQAHFIKFDWVYLQRTPGKAEKKEVYAEWEKQFRGVLEQAGELAPDDKTILLTRLELAIDRNDARTALDLAATGIEKHATERRFYILGADANIRLGKPEDATKMLLKGLEVMPKSVELNFELALNYLRMGQLDEGRKATEVTREAALQSNSFQRLRSAFLQAQLAVVDKSSEKRANIAEGLLVSQRENLASHAQEWQAKGWATPNDIRRQLGLTHQSLAKLYMTRGAWDRALPHFLEWERNDRYSAIFAEAGYWKCQKQLGHLDDAIRAYRILRKQNEQLFFLFEDLWSPAFTAVLEQQAALPVSKRNREELDGMLKEIDKNKSLSLAKKEELHAMVDRVFGQVKESRDTLIALLAADPKNENAWMQLAILDFSEKGADAALATVAKAIETAGDSTRLRKLKGDFLVRKQSPTLRRDLQELENGLTNITDKQRAVFLMDLAQLQYYMVHDVEAARRLVREASKLDPGDTRAQWALFEYARDEEDLEGVTQIAQEIRDSQGTNSQDWQLVEATRYMLQMVKNGRSDPANMAQAKTLLIEIAKKRPNWYEANLLEAQLAYLDGNLDLYIARILDCLDKQKGGKPNPQLIQRVVPMLLQRGKIDEALATLNIVPEEQRGPDLQQISVAIHLAKQNPSAAVAEAKKIMETVKSDGRLWLWYGSVLSEAGQLNDAGAAFAKAVELAPTDPDMYLAYMEYLVTVDPTHERARAQLVQMEQKLDAKRRAFALGIGHFLLGDPARSEDLFREAKAAEPGNVGLRRAIAQFYLLKRGYQNKASDELTELLAMGSQPSDETNRRWARRELARLRAASGMYWQQKEALDLLEQNRVDGVLSEEDLLQKARILASRPDSDSRRKAIAILERDFLEAKKPLGKIEQLMLASLYEQVGSWSKSSERIRSLVAQGRNKDDFDVVSLYVKLSIKHDDLQTAESWQDALEKIQPNSDLTKALRAQLLFRQNKQAQALNILRDMVPKPVPKDKAGLAVRVAELMVTLKFYDDAESLYSEYVRLVPDGKLVLADFMGRYRDLQGSLDICEDILSRLSPDRNSNDWMKVLEVAIYTVRARQSQVTPQQMEKVASWIKRGATANPDSVEFRLKSAEFLELTGKYDEVITLYRKLLTEKVKKGAADDGIAPELRAVTLNNLAYLLAITDPPQAEEALTLIKEAIDILGPIRDLLDTRGVVYLRLGKAKEALADLNDVLLDHNARDLEDRTFGLKYFHLALAQFATNDIPGAEKSMANVERLKMTREDLPTGERAAFEKLVGDLKAIQAKREADKAERAAAEKAAKDKAAAEAGKAGKGSNP